MLPAWPVSRLPTRLCWVSTSPSLLGGSQKGVCSADRVNLCRGKGDVCIGLEREAVWAGRKVSQRTVELTSLDPGDTHRERLLEAQAGQGGKPDMVAHAEPTNRGAQFIVVDSFASSHSISIINHDRVHGDGPLLLVVRPTPIVEMHAAPAHKSST